MASRSAGWVPNQHGAWAMLALPFLVGAVRGIKDGTFWPVLLVLLALWFVGYFAFYAAGLWLKSRRRPRYRRALVTYGGVSAVLGLGVLALDWRLASWLPVFVPLLAVGLWAAAHRTERSVLSGGVMVAAASVMSLVAYTAGRTRGSPWAALADAPAPILAITALVFVYFFGTVLYVKAMIRRRGVPRYERASVWYHVAVTVLPVPMALWHDPTWWWAVTFLAAMAVRAGVVTGHRPTPMALGLGEIASSVALAVVALTLR